MMAAKNRGSVGGAGRARSRVLCEEEEWDEEGGEEEEERKKREEEEENSSSDEGTMSCVIICSVSLPPSLPSSLAPPTLSLPSSLFCHYVHACECTCVCAHTRTHTHTQMISLIADAKHIRARAHTHTHTHTDDQPCSG